MTNKIFKNFQGKLKTLKNLAGIFRGHLPFQNVWKYRLLPQNPQTHYQFYVNGNLFAEIYAHKLNCTDLNFVKASFTRTDFNKLYLCILYSLIAPTIEYVLCTSSRNSGTTSVALYEYNASALVEDAEIPALALPVCRLHQKHSRGVTRAEEERKSLYNMCMRGELDGEQ